MYQIEHPAETPEEIRARHEANRIAWNEGAAVYQAANAERVQMLRDGQSSLHPIERQNLLHIHGRGPFRNWCRRAIHLQCASGQDTLSLLVEGAHEVVGVDISDVHIANARWTAEQLGWNARFYRCDILDTPDELNSTADLLYTGQGALCWIHDINGWARVVSRLLKPGGIFHILDDHPASWLFDQETATLTVAGTSYFGHAEQNGGWSETYIGNQGKTDEEHAVKHERLWTLAEIFQALTTAGLTITHLGEYADEYWNAFPKLAAADKQKLPMTFSMMGVKRL